MNLTKLIPAIGFAKDLVDTIKGSKIKDALEEAEEERGITGAKGTGIRNRIRALGGSPAAGSATGMKRGGPVKKPSRKASGGSVSSKGKSSASKRADGIAKKGKTRGKIV